MSDTIQLDKSINTFLSLVSINGVVEQTNVDFAKETVSSKIQNKEKTLRGHIIFKKKYDAEKKIGVFNLELLRKILGNITSTASIVFKEDCLMIDIGDSKFRYILCDPSIIEEPKVTLTQEIKPIVMFTLTKEQITGIMKGMELIDSEVFSITGDSGDAIIMVGEKASNNFIFNVKAETTKKISKKFIKEHFYALFGLAKDTGVTVEIMDKFSRITLKSTDADATYYLNAKQDEAVA